MSLGLSLGLRLGGQSASISDFESSAPEFTSASTITGTPYVGNTLICVPGTRTGYPTSTLTYQWQENDGGWTNIAEAASSLFTLTDSQVDLEVRCVVTATNSEGSDTSTTDPVGPVDYVHVAPTFTGNSTLDGFAIVGQEITCTAGTVTGYPTPSLAYQWRRDGSNISGATSATYTIVEDDLDSMLDCVATATNVAGSDTSTTESIGPVEPPAAAPVFTVDVSISGDGEPYATLTGTPGTVTGYPTPSRSYRWQVNDSGWQNISGAVNLTFIPDETYEGYSIRLVETATNSEGSVESTSNAIDITPLINLEAPEFTGASTLSSDAIVGTEIVCTPGTVTGYPTPSLTYQWEVNDGEGWDEITDATSAGYTPIEADEGSTLRCVVTATNSEGSDTSTTDPSDPIEPLIIPEAPEFTTASTLSGDPYWGETFTVTPGTVTGTPTPDLSYQWEVEDGTWQEVEGAIATTFTPDETYEGLRIRCVVTATNTEGTDTSTTDPTEALTEAPAAPEFTGSSTISGDTIVGETLTANVSAVTGNPTPDVTIQWQADDGDGWDDLPDEDGSTLLLDAAWEGYDIRFIATATNSEGTDTSTSASVGPVEGIPAGTAPDFVGSTFIYGVAEVDETLICVPATVTGDPTPTLAYQWQADDGGWGNIDDATDDEFTVTSDLIDLDIRCVVTATNSEGTDTSTSNVLTVAGASSAPSVAAVGTHQHGLDALSVAWPSHSAGQIGILIVETANQVVSTPSGWTELGSSPQSGGTVGGANGFRLTVFGKVAESSSESNVTVGDVGDHQIAAIFVLSGVDELADIYTSAGDTSTPGANPYAMPVVTTDGANHLILFTLGPRNDALGAQVSNFASSDGSVTQHLNEGSAAGNGGGIAVFSYVKASAGTIAAATFDTTVATVNLPRITYAVRGASGGSGPENTAIPEINGTFEVGQTLSISGASWNLGSPTATITHQWYRDGAPISGATSSTYELVDDDEGTMISYRQFASNIHGLVYADAAEVGPIDPFEEAPSEDGIFGDEFGDEFA